jgi:hypothetical protein
LLRQVANSATFASTIIKNFNQNQNSSAAKTPAHLVIT